MHRTSILLTLLCSLLTACGAGAAQSAPTPAEPDGTPPSEPAAAACANTAPRPPRGASTGACTEIGCSSGFGIDLEPSDSWPPGQYTFELTAGGQRQQCTGTLPLAACGQPSVTCTGDAIASIGESGCALSAAQHAFGPLAIEQQPCEVQVTIRRDGRLVGEQSLTPNYRWTQPNGAGCDPQCLQAPNAVLALTL